MFCAECDHETKVVDSRRKNNGIYRRRECVRCGKRFSTYEAIVGNVKPVDQAESKWASYGLYVDRCLDEGILPEQFFEWLPKGYPR